MQPTQRLTAHAGSNPRFLKFGINNVMMYFCKMGRKPTTHSNSMYSLAAQAIDGMNIGASKVIDMPVDLPFFRKYLSEIAKREGKRFTTKSTGTGLEIMRVKYYSIHSKEIEI